MSTPMKKERRQKYRFDLECDLKYGVIGKGRPAEAGAGKTLNVSSAGVCFTTAHGLPTGAKIQLSIAWPCLLEGACPLSLALSGRVEWCCGGLAAMSIESYEFRTRGRAVIVPVPKVEPAQAREA